jgi:hypothetical protein
VSKKPVSIQSRRKGRIEEDLDEGEIIYNVIDPDQDAAFNARWEAFWALFMQSALDCYTQDRPQAA